MRKTLAAVVCLLLPQAAMADDGTPSAIDRYHAFKDKLVAEKTAHDWAGFRQTAKAFSAFLKRRAGIPARNCPREPQSRRRCCCQAPC